MATSRTRKADEQPEEPLDVISEEELLRLYEPFRFLEADHWGEFLVVTDDGRYVVGPNEAQAVKEARGKYGPGLTILRVGEITTGKLPW